MTIDMHTPPLHGKSTLVAGAGAGGAASGAAVAVRDYDQPCHTLGDGGISVVGPDAFGRSRAAAA